MEFAPSTLSSYGSNTDGFPPRLAVEFLGLFGPQGPLPLHLTEYARERLRQYADPTFARFCDVFHHRMLSLFYRAWANSDPAVSFDRPDRDRFGFYLSALFGLALPSLRERDEFPDLAKLYFAGHLACQTRHPEGLRAMLCEFFRVKAQIEEFVGEWMDIPRSDQTRLGMAPHLASLGVSSVAGARVWSRQFKFRILLGPLRLARYRDFLPGGLGLLQLTALVRNYVGDELSWDVNLVLCAEDVPAACLDGGAQLGWTTWMGERDGRGDADDLCLNPFFIRATV